MIEQDIVEALENKSDLVSLVGTNIYPDHLPQSPEYPNIVYIRQEGQYLVGIGGESGLRNAIFEFHVRAEKFEMCAEIAELVKTTINAATAFSHVYLGLTTLPYEAGLERYRRIVEFSIWYS